MYEVGCGLDKVTMSWGHDEYLYRVLINHGATIPEEGLYAIRFHSFYPWHAGNDYQYLTNNKDQEMKKWVKEFKWVHSENLPKSRIQYCERSELGLHFEWTKVHFKNAKNGQFWRVLENLNFAVKQCYQTGQFY